jgi:hypothetical protein
MNPETRRRTFLAALFQAATRGKLLPLRDFREGIEMRG